MLLSRLFIVTVSAALLITTSSCTRRISPNTYSAASVAEASQVFKGHVISVRKVTVQEAERLQDNTLGMGAGALAGGFLGSQIGGGKSSHVVGGVLGALAGGVAGTLIQDQLGSQEAFEYTVQLDNGRIMSVVQGIDEVYTPGQRVMVIISHQGRSRVIPDNSQQQVQIVYAAHAQAAPLQTGSAPVQMSQVPHQTMASQSQVVHAQVAQPVQQTQQQVAYAPSQGGYANPQPQIIYHRGV